MVCLFLFAIFGFICNSLNDILSFSWILYLPMHCFPLQCNKNILYSIDIDFLRNTDVKIDDNDDQNNQYVDNDSGNTNNKKKSSWRIIAFEIMIRMVVIRHIMN